MRPPPFTASLLPQRLGGGVRQGEGRGPGGEKQGLGSSHSTHLVGGRQPPAQGRRGLWRPGRQAGSPARDQEGGSLSVSSCHEM